MHALSDWLSATLASKEITPARIMKVLSISIASTPTFLDGLREIVKGPALHSLFVETVF